MITRFLCVTIGDDEFAREREAEKEATEPEIAEISLAERLAERFAERLAERFGAEIAP